MSAFGGPNVSFDGLKVFLDVNNIKCNPSGLLSPITNDYLLYNLAKNTTISHFYNDQNTEIYQSLESHNNIVVLYHNAYDGVNRSTTWRSDTTITRVNDYTFSSWFRFDNVGQQVTNIYGGGFDSQTAFYMSPGGSSENQGVLLYSDAGATNALNATANYGANDNKWHMRSFSVTGPDVGIQTCKFYIDGKLVNTSQTNSSHDNPDGEGIIRIGSWTTTLNMKGYINDFMYYERILSDLEIETLYYNTRAKYLSI